MQTFTETHDPSELKDYAYDWSRRLDVSETISTQTVEFVQAAGTSNPTNSYADGVSRVWISGGTDGLRAIFTVRITTSAGRTLEEAFGVDIVDKGIAAVAESAAAETPAVQRTTTQIALELADYRTARAAMIRGERVTEVWRDGRRMTMANVTLSQIDSAIASLEREYAAATAVEGGTRRRRPISLGYRN